MILPLHLKTVHFDRFVSYVETKNLWGCGCSLLAQHPHTQAVTTEEQTESMGPAGGMHIALQRGER